MITSKRKQYNKRIALLLCTFLFVMCNINSKYTALASENISYNNIDSMLQDSVEKLHIPGMSIEIVNSKEVLFSGTYGNCDSLDTPFILGSLSKSFTAASIMQLVEAKKINLDDPVSKYIDSTQYFKNSKDGDKITIKQLLNQTSGLGTYQRFKTAEITNTYGEHKYANVNYSILGKVIESVSGESYEEYVTKNIFNPLDMKNSSASYEKATENGLINGYKNYFGVPVKGKPDFPTDKSWFTVSAGYLSSSASDMGKYLQMYLNKGSNILSKESINTMFYSNVYVDSTTPYYYGMGWAVDIHSKEEIINHTGLVENYMSSMCILPERDIAIVILINTNDYLVTNRLINIVNQNVLSAIKGTSMENINDTRYYLEHGILDLIYLSVILCGLVPLLRIKKWKGIKRSTKTKSVLIIVVNILVHAIFPTILLMLSSIIKAPLWVLWYFVKDLFIVILLASTLLYLGGILKLIHVVKNR